MHKKLRLGSLVENLEARRLLSTWIVDTSGSGNFTSLTAALNSSTVQNGDTVLVHPGTYLGGSGGNGYPVVKSLTIQSTGGAANTILTVPDGTTNAVALMDSGTILDGFTIQGGINGVVVSDINSATIDVINNVVVENNIIDPTTNASGQGSGNGILIQNANSSVISNNTIGESYQSGIYLTGASNTIADENTINGTVAASGITVINNSSYNVFEENTINDAYFDGISNTSVNGNVYERNTITGAGVDGVTLTNGSDNNFVDNNTIVFVQRSGRPADGIHGVGVWINDGSDAANEPSDNNTVIGNFISGASENGIAVYQSSDNYIDDNETTGDLLGGIFVTSIDTSGVPVNNVLSQNYSFNDLGPGAIILRNANNTQVSDGFYQGSNRSTEPAGIIFQEYTATQADTDSTVYNNTVYQMGSPLNLTADTADTTIYNNRFIDNSTRSYIIKPTTVALDAGPVIGGNYYSDETGVSGNPSTGSTPYNNFYYDNTGAFHAPYSDRYPFASETLGKTTNVTVTAPLADTSISRGSTRIIRWSAPGATFVGINLVTAAGVVTSIAANAPNTGAYTWTVPANLAAGDGYQIEVTPLNSSGTTVGNAGSSPALSVQADGTNDLDLLTPSIATRAAEGSTVRVAWARPAGATGGVNVQIQLDGGDWQTLASNVTGDYADVMLPSTPSSQARIRIVDSTHNTSDTMDGTFVIQGDVGAFTAAPSGSVTPGTETQLRWTSPAGSASVKIDESDGTNSQTIAPSVPDIGSYLWDAPDYNSSNATIQLTFFDANGNSLGTATTSPFTIAGSGSTITFQTGNGSIGGGGGGSGGSGGNGASVTLTTFLSAKFSGNLVGGSKTKITGSVIVTNNSAQAFNATVPVALYLSSSSSALDGSAAIVSKPEKLKLNSHQTKKISLAFTVPAGLAEGTYYLYAEATPSGGEALSAAAGPATISPAFVDLSLTNLADTTPIVQGSKTKPKLTFTIANGGNVVANGKATLTLFASSTGGIAGETQLSQSTVSINLKANGGTKSFSLSPIIAAGLVAAGDYTLIGVLTAPSGENEPAVDLADNTDIGSSVPIS